MKSIETERLLLRKWETKDYLDLFEVASDPEVGRNAGQSTLHTLDDAKRVLSNYIATDRSYAIVLTAENKAIGSIGYDKFIPDESLVNKIQFSIGFTISPQYWGKGYATEALRHFMNELFSEFKADILWCSHFNFNERSKRVIEKCGFEYRFTRERIVKALDNATVSELFYTLNNPHSK